MFRVLATSFLLFSTALPQVAAAQSGDPLDRIRLTLYEMGLLAIMPSPVVEDGVVLVENMRVRPKDEATWNLTFEKVEIEGGEGSGLSLRPSGEVAFSHPGKRLDGKLQSSGFEMWVAPESDSGALEGWSIQVPEANLSLSSPFGMGTAQIQGLSYKGSETDRLHARHEWSIDQVQGSMGAGAQTRALRMRGSQGYVELLSGGYLESYPWMAAIQEGMQADARWSWKEAHFNAGAPDEGARQEMRTGEVQTMWKQDKDAIKATWTLADGMMRKTSAQGDTEILNATAEGSVQVPTQKQEESAPFSLDMGATADVALDGRMVPMSGMAKMEGWALV